MKTLTTLVLGMVIGAASMAAVAAVPVGPADDATKAAVQEVKRGIVAGHKAKDRLRSIGCMRTTTPPSMRKV